jgi:hypothetical protein
MECNLHLLLSEINLLKNDAIAKDQEVTLMKMAEVIFAKDLYYVSL